ncbi:unnamed protein product [Lampetra fluviatilis]
MGFCEREEEEELRGRALHFAGRGETRLFFSSSSSSYVSRVTARRRGVGCQWCRVESNVDAEHEVSLRRDRVLRRGLAAVKVGLVAAVPVCHEQPHTSPVNATQRLIP